MPDPTRPVAGAPIDTDWGQQVHDRVFQPKGVRVSGDVQAIGLSAAQCDLSNIVDDPGGWMSGDTATVPSGAGGLYSWGLRVSSDDGDVGEWTNVTLRINGVNHVLLRIHSEGSTIQHGAVADIVELAAGDTITVFAAKSGGPNHNVTVMSLQFVLIGTSIGA
jgi:hypothetical protein